MPGLSGISPVALAIAAISTMVLEPSTNSTSMRGFMFRCVASARYSSGVASMFSGLFLPLPALTTRWPMAEMNSISSMQDEGSSPAPRL